VKARASLLKTLTRFDRCSKMYLARMETDSTWTLNSGDTDELAQTSRQIARVQLNIMKLSRELASVSRQIRALVLGKITQPMASKQKEPMPGRVPPLQRLAPKTEPLWCAS
jgi:hypothetical protein